MDRLSIPRRAALLALALGLALPAPAASAAPAASWARRQVVYVVQQGVFPSIASAAQFRPQDPLTVGALARLVAAVPDAQPAALPADATAHVTIGQLDAAFVQAVGLRDVAADVARGLRRAGLHPPAGAGIEVVARTLGLRYDHPQAEDALEASATDLATRADGAYSAWKVLTQGEAARDYVRSELAGLALPAVSAGAQPALDAALGQIGQPYVWAGTSPADGGFDCSGLVTYAEGAASWLGGRSSYAMAAATPPAQRIPLDAVQPGDLLFFGPRGPDTPPAQIDHVALALGGGWFVHASSEGVSLARVDWDWYAGRFAFARRPGGAASPG